MADGRPPARRRRGRTPAAGRARASPYHHSLHLVLVGAAVAAHAGLDLGRRVAAAVDAGPAAGGQHRAAGLADREDRARVARRRTGPPAPPRPARALDQAGTRRLKIARQPRSIGSAAGVVISRGRRRASGCPAPRPRRSRSGPFRGRCQARSPASVVSARTAVERAFVLQSGESPPHWEGWTTVPGSAFWWLSSSSRSSSAAAAGWWLGCC